MCAKDQNSELVLTLQDKHLEVRALVQELDTVTRKNKRNTVYSTSRPAYLTNTRRICDKVIMHEVITAAFSYFELLKLTCICVWIKINCSCIKNEVI